MSCACDPSVDCRVRVWVRAWEHSNVTPYGIIEGVLVLVKIASVGDVCEYLDYPRI